MNTVFKTPNGNLIDICAGFASVSLQKKVYDGKKYVELGSLYPSQLFKRVMRLNKFLPPFTPFNQSLKAIYGNDFFRPTKIELIPDGCLAITGNTDGDIHITRMPCGHYPYIMSNPVKILTSMFDKKIGHERNQATKKFGRITVDDFDWK